MKNRISRRTLLSTVGLATLWGFTPAVSAAAAAKKLASLITPEQTEGPFYIERQMIRADVTEGKPGVPLQLELRVVDKNGEPVRKAAIDIWHCDAEGKYSGFAKLAEMGPPPGFSGFHDRVMFDHPFKSRHKPGSDGPGGDRVRGARAEGDEFARSHSHSHSHSHMGPPPRIHPTDESTFLRGTQITDDEGKVRFASIYPGWYAGRALHIHLKVHTGGTLVGEASTSHRKDGKGDAPNSLSYNGGHVSHTGQLFFPPKISDSVALLEPYSRLKTGRMPLDDDMIFVSQGGKSTMVNVSQIDKGAASHGFIARSTLCIDPESTPQKV
jgi:protocatechuate 3,4-dioxygenase beta subunit